MHHATATAERSQANRRPQSAVCSLGSSPTSVIITASPRGVQEEGQRSEAHMALEPYIGRFPEAWEDQRMHRLNWPAEGYLAEGSASVVYRPCRED